MSASRLRIGAIFATLALVGTAAPLARADEPRARVEVGTRASVRRLMVDDDFAAARMLVDQLLAAENAPEGRAAETELVFVLDAWSSAGRRPRAAGSDVVHDLPEPDVESEWQPAFIAAREALVRGAFAESARRFDALVARAPGLVTAARASELRTLAREALKHDVSKRAGSAPAPKPSAPERAEPEANGEHWYGAQTLIVDGAALLTAPFSPGLGLATYALGGPIVHLAHGRPLASLASLGLRTTAPIAGALVPVLFGVTAGCSGDCLEPIAVGAVLGMAAAVVIDAAAIARETAAPREGEKKAEKVAAFRSIAPSAAVRREGGLTLGLGGAF